MCANDILAAYGRDHSLWDSMGATLLFPDAMTLPHTVARGQGLLVEEGLIRDVVSRESPRYPVVELQGTLLPGFVDLQVNGISGHSVHEGEVDALEGIATSVWNGGAVAFLPTLITAPFDQLLERLASVARWIRDRSPDRSPEGAVPLGIHLEGPFLENPGAHDPDLFLDPTQERIEAVLNAAAGQLRLVTLASSRKGSAAAIRRLGEAGVTASLGHVRSTDGFGECVAAGARLVTHLFNAMGPLHHREPTIAGLALDADELGCMLIADGIHVHPSMVRNAFRCLGTGRTLLVTDAVAAAGMPDGEYELGGMAVHLREGVVRDEKGRLAGSALTMTRAAMGFLDMVPDIGPWSLAQVAATNPARYLGFEDWGSIEPGRAARFTLLRPDGTVQALHY